MDADQAFGTLVAGTCTTLIQHEAIRTQSVESNAFSQLFLEKLDKWRDACSIHDSSPDTLTAAEESLMQLMPCDPHADINWMQKLSQKVSEAIAEQQQKVSTQKVEGYGTYEELTVISWNVKTLLGKHHKLMADVKTLLKAMTKIDDCADKVQEYLQNHKQFLENFAPLLRFSSKISPDNVEDVLESLEVILRDVDGVFEDLLTLEEGEKSEDRYNHHRAPLVRQDGMLSPKKCSPKHEAGKGQQRNAYAVGVWRRVRMKLEGRDPDPGRKYTLQEQVNLV